MVMSGELFQVVHQGTDRERGWGGGGGLLLRDIYTKIWLLVTEVLRRNHPNMHVLPMENFMCSAFEEC